MSIHNNAHSSSLDRSSLERLAAVFRAFGDATRLALLQELKSGARSVNELQVALGTSQANISRQLKVLHDAGLLSRERRGAQVFLTSMKAWPCRREPFMSKLKTLPQPRGSSRWAS